GIAPEHPPSRTYEEEQPCRATRCRDMPGLDRRKRLDGCRSWLAGASSLQNSAKECRSDNRVSAFASTRERTESRPRVRRTYRTCATMGFQRGRLRQKCAGLPVPTTSGIPATSRDNESVGRQIPGSEPANLIFRGSQAHYGGCTTRCQEQPVCRASAFCRIGTASLSARGTRSATRRSLLGRVRDRSVE